jgi:hypothetical protein
VEGIKIDGEIGGWGDEAIRESKRLKGSRNLEGKA